MSLPNHALTLCRAEPGQKASSLSNILPLKHAFSSDNEHTFSSGKEMSPHRFTHQHMRNIGVKVLCALGHKTVAHIKLLGVRLR